MEKFNRKEITNSVLEQMAQALTKEQLAGMMRFFNAMTDQQFEEWMQLGIKMTKENGEMTNREYTDLLSGLTKKNNITYENSGLNLIPCELLGKEDNDRLWRKICESYPTDHIILNSKSDEAIQKLYPAWNENIAESKMFANASIPLLDCEITVDERDNGGMINEFRVVIFSDYTERIRKADAEESVTVGAVMTKIQNGFLINPILITKDIDAIKCAYDMGYYNLSSELKRRIKAQITQKDSLYTFCEVMKTWLGIESAMQDQKTRSIFEHSQTEVVIETTAQDKKYIRQHIIHTDDIEKALKK